MNNRIKELVIEAGIIVSEYNGFDRNILFPKEIKFAQLIIKECSEAMIEEDCFYGEWMSRIINERFGLEYEYCDD